ncbi:MAG: GGDEF domain-containing protein [Candidatus Omnitrophica bacterium]|nr:GGDEF domain-containing protein [Candidatus Omnitrophota bacterium]
MSVLPLLVGVYIASLFITYPFRVSPDILLKINLVMLSSVILSFAGYKITIQMVSSITNLSRAAGKIASGDLMADPSAGQEAEELEALSASLKAISKSARELLEKVERLSLKDRLTGLYNASYIRERLGEEIGRAVYYQRPCSFAYLVVEHAEAYEAREGRAAWEEVLKAVAGILSGHLGEFGRAARISGYEFTWILPDTNKKKAIEIVERIRLELQKFFDKRGISPEALGVSVGISENPLDGGDANAIYFKAQDRARAVKIPAQSRVEAF